MNGIKNMLLTGMMLVVAGGIAWAQGAAEDRDPFHPSGTRPPAAPVPADPEWGRDPFANPLAGRTPAGKASSHRASASGLTGIIYSKKARVAIIGGEVLSEGSMVNGKRLVDIRRKSVVLMDGSGRYEELFLEDFSIGR